MAMPTEHEIRARQEAASRVIRQYNHMQQVYAEHRQQLGHVPRWQKPRQAQDAVHNEQQTQVQHAFGADDEAWDSWVASRRQLDRAVAVEKQKQHAQDAVHNQQLKKQKQPMQGEAHHQQLEQLQQQAQDVAHHQQLKKPMQHAQDAVHDEQQDKQMLLSQWREVQRMNAQFFAAPAAHVDTVLARWVAESEQCDEQTSQESKEQWFVVQ